MTHSLAILLIFVSFCPAALSQQEVTFPQAPSDRLPIWRGYGEQVNAILTLPSNTTGKVPAVVLIHTRGGYDPTHYDFYGAALRQAGFATLGLILYYSSPRHLPSDLVPHAYGALKYLASHPAIDPNRIAIMGFSLGGILAVYTASAMLTSEHLGDGPRYAAHVAFYPVCSIHQENVTRVPRGKRFTRLPNVYSALAGARVHILAGGNDQYDDPDSCQKFLAALTPEARKYVTLTYYPDATHTWDVPGQRTHFAPTACKGLGCEVTNAYDPEIAQKGRQVALDFLSSILLSGKAPGQASQ